MPLFFYYLKKELFDMNIWGISFIAFSFLGVIVALFICYITEKTDKN